VSLPQAAAPSQRALVFQLIRDPGVVLLAFVDAEEIQQVFFIASPTPCSAMLRRGLGIFQPAQVRAILAQQNDGGTTHGRHAIPGRDHAINPAGQDL